MAAVDALSPGDDDCDVSTRGLRGGVHGARADGDAPRERTRDRCRLHERPGACVCRDAAHWPGLRCPLPFLLGGAFYNPNSGDGICEQVWSSAVIKSRLQVHTQVTRGSPDPTVPCTAPPTARTRPARTRSPASRPTPPATSPSHPRPAKAPAGPELNRAPPPRHPAPGPPCACPASCAGRAT